MKNSTTSDLKVGEVVLVPGKGKAFSLNRGHIDHLPGSVFAAASRVRIFRTGYELAEDQFPKNLMKEGCYASRLDEHDRVELEGVENFYHLLEAHARLLGLSSLFRFHSPGPASAFAA